jgi:transcriptional regulator with XRE-family HTH domain
MAELIRETLAAEGITQAAFCRRVGVSAKHLNQVLSGNADARPATLDYWAFALGMRFVVALEPRPPDV